MEINYKAGDKLGKLTIVQESAELIPDGTKKYLCECDCGVAIIIDATVLENGGIRSCGRCRKIFPGDIFGE